MENLINRVLYKEIKKVMVESFNKDTFVIKTKDGEPVEQFETRKKAEDALEAYKKKYPKQELLIEPSEALDFEDLDEIVDDLNEEGECDECSKKRVSEGVCKSCGKTICECKMKNKKLKIKESELIKIIKSLVNESAPSKQIQNTTHQQSGKINSEYLTNTAKKIKKYLSFKGNDNPEFPNQIGGKVKAKRLREKEVEDISMNRGGGMEDLDYDLELSKKTKERHKGYMAGDTKNGNMQGGLNTIKTKTGTDMYDKALKKRELKKDMPMYKKDPQPTKTISETFLTKKEIMRSFKK